MRNAFNKTDTFRSSQTPTDTSSLPLSSPSVSMPPTVIQRSNVIVSRSTHPSIISINRAVKDVNPLGHCEPEGGTPEKKGFPWSTSTGTEVPSSTASRSTALLEAEDDSDRKATKLKISSKGPGMPPALQPHFTCDLCNKTFRHKSYFDYHLRTHSGERPYQCSMCAKGFFERSKLNRHLSSVHNMVKSQCDKEIDKETDKTPNTCLKCGKSFTRLDGLKAHLLTHEGKRDRHRHRCKICGQGFLGLTSLKNHQKGHQGSKNILCPICGKAFLLKQYLDLHLSTTHKQQQRRHKCSRCHKDFHSNKDLRRHQLIHSNDKNFKCQLCHVSFKRNDNLNRHFKLSHSLPPEQAGADNPPKLNDAKMEIITENVKPSQSNSPPPPPPAIAIPLPTNRQVSVIKSTHEFIMSMSANKTNK